MIDLRQAAPALWWALAGVALAGAHLLMLRRALNRAEPLGATRAGSRLAATMPIRLLALSPVLLIAARAGLWACVWLVAGSLTGRWLFVRRLQGQRALLMRGHKQGQTRGH